jgi:DNA-directed RNA polymerase specialized sigma subunit
MLRTSKRRQLQRRRDALRERISEHPAAMQSRRVDWTVANEMWRRYRHDGDASAFGPLIESLLPIITHIASDQKRFNRLYRFDPVDELIADGYRGLVLLAKRTDDETLRQFIFQMRLTAREEMRRGVCMRHFGGEQAFRRDCVIQEQRGRLTQQLGREPNRAELIESLRPLLTNPQIQIGELPERLSLETGADARAGAEDATATIDDPTQRMIDAEVIRLAKKSLKGIDRKIFDLCMRGESAREIGRQLNLNGSTAQKRKRINGTLWAIRRNAELAKYLHQPAIDANSAAATAARAAINVNAFAPSVRRRIAC